MPMSATVPLIFHFAINVGAGGVMHTFFEERIFHGQQGGAFQLTVKEKQEQAKEADQGAYFLKARYGNTYFKSFIAMMAHFSMGISMRISVAFFSACRSNRG